MISRPSPQQKRSTTTMDIRIGIMLATLRRHKNMSQSDIANALNVSFQQIQKYEKGKNRISLSRFLDLCKIIGVKPSDFIKKLENPDTHLLKDKDHGNKVINEVI